MNLTPPTLRGNLLALIGAVPVSFVVARATLGQCEVAQVAGLKEVGNDFGRSVAISGELAVVGDPGVMGAPGSAYVYRLGPAGPADWQLEAVLITPGPGGTDAFGVAVAVSTNLVVVGAVTADAPEFNQGAAYVYRFDGADWQFEVMLTASDGQAGDSFGRSVAIDGNVALIGALEVVVDGMSQAGAAYIYRFNEKKGEWIEQAKLIDPAPQELGLVGASVSINGDVALVGAYGTDLLQGSALVFRYNPDPPGEWRFETEILSDGVGQDWFGWSVSLADGVAIVGAFQDNSTDKGNGAGSAYISRYDGVGWVEEQKITASDAAPLDWFGFSVTISEDGQTIASGAIFDAFGSTYVFRLIDGRWQETAKLTASDGGPGDNFGGSVALSQDMLLVGSHRGSQRPGRAYFFAGLSDIDCNDNGEPDACDIFDGASDDQDGNGIPDECESIPGDINGDGAVGVKDLLILLGSWGPCPDCDKCPADLDQNCTVGVADLLILLGNWS